MLSRYVPVLALLVAFALTGVNGLSAVAAEPAAGGSRPVIHGILYNDDGGGMFVLDPAGTMKPERLDSYVDALADSQITKFLLAVCDQTTIYPTKVWDVAGWGFDPAKDDNQPFFGPYTGEQRAGLRQYWHNLRVLLDAGIDPVERMLKRCRQRNMSPWVSVRMNDAHDADVRNSPLHSRFWMEHFDWRNNSPCHGLNFGLKPVRDRAMALLREVCDRFDFDGLELDWNRFPNHFNMGEEIEQGKVLSEWMVEVREAVRAAEKKWKHPICLAARVPARPEVSLGTGLDAVTWAKRGLIDHLIVAPFWATTDYDIPVERWIELLRGTGVGVTAGLECNVRPYWTPTSLPNTPERRRGAAMAALGRGSQGIYLFNYNYSEVTSKMPHLYKELGSIDTLADKDRSYVVTYVDINIPGKPIPSALPKKLGPGESAEFSLFIGPKPLASGRGEVQLTLAPERPEDKCVAQVALNSQPPAAAGGFAFGSDAFREGYNAVRVVNAGTSAMNIQGVELSLRFPAGGKK